MAGRCPVIGKKIWSWEQETKSAMGTLVEWTTRFTMLAKLDYKDSDYACLNYTNKLAALQEMLRRSLANDRGKEMTYHNIISGLAEVKIYFCDPRSPRSVQIKIPMNSWGKIFKKEQI